MASDSAALLEECKFVVGHKNGSNVVVSKKGERITSADLMELANDLVIEAVKMGLTSNKVITRH